VKLFIERLSSQFRAACGEKLIVTSLTRPESEQPYNASDQSVHPRGMAVDLRVPGSSRCRGWLEDVLLSLEDGNVLDATRERNPPHYHVAVFPDPYERYVASLQRNPQYVVQKGDSLTGIARAMGTTVPALRAENGIQGDLIRPGEPLRIPGGTVETYRVKPGDSLAAIARLFQTTIDALTAANDLRGDLILAGQILVVNVP
jgi:LysM repeat protein